MKVELGKIGSITHGVVLNRVKPKAGEDEVLYPLLTISRFLQEEEGKKPDKAPVVSVGVSKKDGLRIGKEGMVLVGLTSFHRAVVLSKEHEGMLISSNFLILEFPGGIMDPHYFAWYFNEHPIMKEKKEYAIQGDGKVKVLSIRLVRNMEIEIPSLVSQMSIGSLYSLQLQKERLLKAKMKLEQKDLTYKILEQTEKKHFSMRIETEENIRVLEQKISNIEKRRNIYEQELERLSLTF